MDDARLAGLINAAGYAESGPGVAVVISAGEGLVASKASGWARPGIRFSTRTTTYLASLSKQIIGACAATLVMRGVLDVSAPVSEWLPQLPSWAKGVRVRHLIHHTSGLPTDAELSARFDRLDESRWDSGSVLDALRRSPELRFTPGTRFEYCNAGYIALAEIIDRAAGVPAAEFARTTLFEPIGMRRSAFHSSASSIPSDAADGHPTPAVTEHWPLPLSIGDGGLWSTAQDLDAWNRAVLPGGQMGDPVRSLISVRGQLDDRTPLDYAWGIRVAREHGVLVHSHGGNWPGGWTARSIRLPDLDIGIAAVSNDGEVDRMVRLTDEIRLYLTRTRA
ncbi:serine hydrolase domain-containing protein [Gryllotalpicola reticulitermitis]|uniref:Serine hydrolase domain-containing protein n=1 Tax=Gryllotalpicola reticulitermitis TaxID=1184153 RepID=A0ABV8Q4A0_9MICO